MSAQRRSGREGRANVLRSGAQRGEFRGSVDIVVISRVGASTDAVSVAPGRRRRTTSRSPAPQPAFGARGVHVVCSKGSPRSRSGARERSDANAISARRSPIISLTSASSAAPDSSTLPTNPRAPLRANHRVVMAVVAARCQHDDRSVVGACERRSYFELIEVGEVQVEQRDVRAHARAATIPERPSCGSPTT